MPELPEVQTVVTTLAKHLLGRSVGAVQLHRPDILTPTGLDLPALLLGRTIVSIDRRGKRIVFTLDNQSRFYIHLGMSGRLTLERADAPMLPHTHLTIGFRDSDFGFRSDQHPRPEPRDPNPELRFRDPRRFGGVWWLDSEGAGDENLGPEPLHLTSRDLAQRLFRTRRAIKTALLDQRLIAGLGNIYADESLFAAGIHPLAPANTLSRPQIVRLNRAIKAVLNRAIRHRGSTLRDYVDADGRAGAFQKSHRVYAREGLPCAVCTAAIQRIVLTGRSTHFCPHCQTLRTKP